MPSTQNWNDDKVRREYSVLTFSESNFGNFWQIAGPIYTAR